VLELLYNAGGGSLGSLFCEAVEVIGDSVYLRRGRGTVLLAARYDGRAFILEPALFTDDAALLSQSALTIKVAAEPDGAPLEAIADGRVVAADEHGFRLKALSTATAMLCDASGQIGFLQRRGTIWRVIGGIGLAGSIVVQAAGEHGLCAALILPLGPRSRLSGLAA